MPKPPNYVWHDTDHYNKINGQARMLIAGALQDLRKHGNDVFVDGAVNTIMDVLIQYGMKIRGKDIPYTVEIKRYFEDD